MPGAGPAPGQSRPGTGPPEAAPATRRGSAFLTLRDWRVPWKLVAIVAIPVVALLVLGFLRIVASIGSAMQYGRIQDHAVLSGQLAELADEVELERDRTAAYVAQGRRTSAIATVETQYASVDAAVRAIRGQIANIAGSASSDRLKAVQMLHRLDALPNTRKAAIHSQLDTRTVIRLYRQTIVDLLAYNDDIDRGAVDEELANSVAAFAALSKAKERASTERAIMMAGLASGRLEPALLEEFHAARSQRDSELDAFRANATIDQRQLFDDTVSGRLVDRAEGIRARALMLLDQNAPLADHALGNRTGSTWFDAMTTTLENMRKVEATMAEEIILRSRALKEAEQSAAVQTLGWVLAALLLVSAMAIMVGRSLVQPLRKLRNTALRIASDQLPNTVRALRHSDPTTAPTVVPIDVGSREEIGDVARAFDEVHREAVRLAAEEAKLRGNINAMFVNLSRRSQTLVERQITLIDGLEQGEQDEERLAHMFKLDHLATRMRRNSENLLVLAGQEQPRRWSKPVKLVDVARASLSEVENYERVVLQVPDGVAVAGQAVNDVVHLLAELIENALSFSPHESRVTVASRSHGLDIMLEVSDTGIGMTAEELHHFNERLRHTPEVDVSVSRRMGLFVVARLAQRHNIQVQLRSPARSGLSAMVLLPEALLDTPSSTFTIGSRGQRRGSYATAMPGSVVPSMDSVDPLKSSNSWAPHPDAFWSQGPELWPTGPQTGPGHLGTADAWPPTPDPADGPMDENAWFQSNTVTPGHRSTDPRHAGIPWEQLHDFPATESGATGPIPRVRSAGDEDLPIYREVSSRWFLRGDAGTARWGSAPADAGWSAAEAVVQPVHASATVSGLPKRMPKANLVPGTAQTVTPTEDTRPPVSPEAMRDRLAAYQQGRERARLAISAVQEGAGDSRDGAREA
ncbi:nitrate- and nitrite sensing domain-containing protein [Nonomuraea jabiensis]|uniref:nitrate- and nitrite sensing domain-containing protein n=1 Tax=Nonomuraea jabiensis TaxID=882448 RepID=UPI003D719020